MKSQKTAFIFILLIALPVILFFSIYQEVKEKTITQLNIQQRIMAKQASYGIHKFFNTYRNNLDYLAKNPNIISMSHLEPIIMQQFYESHKPEIMGLTRINKYGVIVHSIPWRKKAIGKSVAHQPHNKRIIKTHKPVVSDVFPLVQGGRAVAFAYPVFKRGSYNGCITAIIPMTILSGKYLRHLKIGKSGYAWMISEQGILLYHPNKKMIGKNIDTLSKKFPEIQKLLKRMIQEKEGHAVYTYYRKGRQEHDPLLKKHAVFSEIKLYNTFWSIAIATPEDKVLTLIESFRNKLFIILAIISLFLSGFIYYFLRARKTTDLEVINKELEKAYSTINMSQSIAFLWKNQDNYPLEFVSENVRHLLGYTKEELLAGKVNFFDLVHKDDYTHLMDELQDFSIDTKRVRFIHEPYRLIAENGTIKWIEDHTQIIRNQSGTITHFHSTILDISKRKEAEEQINQLNRELEQKVENRTSDLKESLERLKQTQDKLIESEKMAALGNLVAGIAHEINTPLGIGVTAASFLKDKTEELNDNYKQTNLKKSELDDYLHLADDSTGIILHNLQRAADLIGSFKQVASDQLSEQLREFNLKEYLSEILRNLHPMLKKTAHTVNISCPENLIINSYPGAFSMIINNLVVNSIKHGFENIKSGTIDIKAKIKEKHLVIKFYDNGAGVSAEMTHKIFEPFYTTKRDDGGTGLGMYIVYNLVTKNLNGDIRCDSKQGEWIRFTIELPESIVVQK